MAEILLTHPGKLGDLVWAAATMKAIAGHHRVDLAVSPYCAPLAPLLEAQPWVDSVFVLDAWKVEFTAPVSPAIPPPEAADEVVAGNPEAHYEDIFHLGMREWPGPTLYDYYPRLMRQRYGRDVTPERESWLTVPPPALRGGIVLAFTDEWKELKAGLIHAIADRFPSRVLWLQHREAALTRYFYSLGKMTLLVDIGQLARFISTARLVVTCNSLPHPLANALGRRCVVVEPSTPRQQSVFKRKHPRNTYIDGFNVEEVLPAIEAALEEEP